MKPLLMEDAFEKVGRILSEKYGIRVVFEGNSCCTNGKVIRLPSLPPEIPPEIMGALRCYLDHEVGHILGESDFELAGHFQKKHGPDAFQVLNALEDLRVDEVMRRTYPGSSINIKAGTEEVLKKLAVTPLEPLRQLVTAIYMQGSGYPPLPFIASEIQALCDSVGPEISAAVKARNSAEVARLAEEVWRKLGSKLMPAVQPKPQPAAGQASGQGDAQSQCAQQDQDQTPGQDPAQAQAPAPPDATAQSQPPDPTTQDPATIGAPDPKSQGAQMVPSGPLSGELAGLIEQGLTKYTDTNHTYRPWTTQHDRVEVAPTKRNHDHAAMLRGVMPYVGGVRQKLLQSLLAETHSRWYGDQEHGRLDPKTLHRLSIGTSERVFRQRVISRARSTLVALVIDLSASMRDSKVVLAAQTALVFAESLDKLSIPSLIMGFTTESADMRPQISAETGIPDKDLAREFRTHPLRITLFKRPEESWRKVSGRLANIHTGNLTPLGEAILIAARALSGRREERKVILVMTDGQPTVGLSEEGRALQHARHSIALCEKSGIEIALVGIMEQRVRALTSKSVVVKSLPELPRAVIGELHGLLIRGGATQ